MDKHLSKDLGHGRIENRVCQVISNFQFITLEVSEKWGEIKQLIKIESIQEFKNSDTEKETITHYYMKGGGEFSKGCSRPVQD